MLNMLREGAICGDMTTEGSHAVLEAVTKEKCLDLNQNMIGLFPFHLT